VSGDRTVLAAVDIAVHFPITRGLLRQVVGYVRAVDGVSLDVSAGETLALVGESGSGKTTLGRVLCGLQPPTRGQVIFEGRPLPLRGPEARRVRAHIQMVYQDPTSSLNPRRRVGDIIADPLVIHRRGDPAWRRRRVAELLSLVELPPDFAYRYPHSLSGGQRQRVNIARALALGPRVLVLDEPTSALDVSVQAKLVHLLKRLQRELDLTYVFISHDLPLVRNIAGRVAVMYLGHLMEIAEAESLFTRPRHPYTRALLSVVPALTAEERRLLPGRVELQGEIPSPAAPPPGCPFHPRCSEAGEDCRRTLPQLRPVDGHLVRCHLVGA